MKSFFYAFCLLSSPLAASAREGNQLSVQNTILTKVNGTTISVVDVMKKMDLLMQKHYPQYVEVAEARCQFYTASWRPVLMEMIDAELMLADAQEKEIKLTDGEVREELMNRFGPNPVEQLDRVGLTYDDAWKMIKKDLTVQRMLWFFVHSKALQAVTPQALKEAYQVYLLDNPPYQEWQYRVISLRLGPDHQDLATEVHDLLVEKGANGEVVADLLKAWETEHPGSTASISKEYTAKESELSESHRTILTKLAAGTYSQPLTQMSRADGQAVHRILYLVKTTDHPAPSFQDLTRQLKEDIQKKAVAEHSQTYMQKLRQRYGFNTEQLKETASLELKPFHLE